ncbi:phage holin family protein [Rhodobacteraceae bacterium B1Z28]|uniref:Phage holin family protein n=1 Tax=Ruegeria haliotis TaxID=2747601 RepID=A0ABX2PS98_9RHOB|nr:phage holin family protein [Ruegeria haliotis]NVO57045.1 phage holin family protein [Ruegeria haliotis]
MNDTTEPYPQGKALALLAYALDVDSDDTISREELDRLVDDVCEDETERARLVSVLANPNNSQLPAVLAELVSSRLDRLKDTLEILMDNDDVFGVWSQRVAGGGLLASIGFTVTSIVTGGWAALAIGAGIVASGATSVGRSKLKKQTRAARRAVEQTERVIDQIKGK